MSCLMFKHLAIVVIPVLLLNLLSADLDLRRSFWLLDRTVIGDHSPDFPISESSLANYTSLAADLAWIDALIQNGERRRSGLPTTTNLIERGHTIVGVDPYFYSVYSWVPAAYLSRRHVASEESLLRISELMDVGISYFPEDADLPFSAAMNFIGHSNLDDKPRRIRELRRAIAYLQVAGERPGAWEDLPNLLSGLTRRLRDIETESGISDELFLEELAASLGQHRAPKLWQTLSPESQIKIQETERIDVAHSLVYLPVGITLMLSL